MPPKQPDDGETILLCAHMRPVPQSVHFFYFPEAMAFLPPGGEWESTSWFLVCSACHKAILLADDPTFGFELIGGYDTWVGDKPLEMRKKD